MDNVATQKRGGAATAFYIIIILILIAAVAFLGYKYYELKKVVPSAPAGISAEEEEEVTEQLGKIMKLPAEKPQVAKVANPDELKSLNPFFKDVQKDDYLLLFPPNKAVIYRPSDNMIVNFDFFIPVGDQVNQTGTGTSTR